MSYREAGQFKTTYVGDQQIFPIRQDRIGITLVLLFAFLVVPVIGDQYWLSAILIPFLVFALAALAVGIPLQQIWAIVWTVAGFVALVSGLLWGARNGVQFALTFTALKALPVLILGGFESVTGAIVGGLIIGASEKLAEIYIPQFLNAPLSEAWGVSVNLAGLEIWFPYALALAFLLIRPEGLFGEKHIDRV